MLILQITDGGAGYVVYDEECNVITDALGFKLRPVRFTEDGREFCGWTLYRDVTDQIPEHDRLTEGD